MNELLTRPIPTIAVEAFCERIALRQREEVAEADLAPRATPNPVLSRWLDAAASRSGATSARRLLQDTMAAAVTFLASCGLQSPAARSAAEFLVVLSDRGVTRPIMDFDAVPIAVEASQPRGAASLQPMSLSAKDAEAMEEAWRKGLARPRITVAPLPQYES